MNGENNYPSGENQIEPKPEQESVPRDENKAESISEKTIEEKGNIRKDDKKSGLDFGRLLVGLFVISFGIFLLAQSANLIPQDITINIFQFWPLLVVAVGLSFLDTSRPMTFLIGLAVFIIVAAMVGTMIWKGTSGGTRMQNVPIEIDKGGNVNLAKVSITANVADVEIKGGAKKLAEGSFETDNAEFKKNSNVSDQTQNVTMDISNPSGWNPFIENRKNNMNLRLNSGLPMDLVFNFNVVNAKIDLSDMEIESVGIESNVSDLELTLSDRRDLSQVDIRANVGQTKIFLPQSLGARVIMNSGIFSKDLRGFDKISETEYRTPDYDKAAKRVEMNLNIDVSDLKIERI